MSRRTDDTFIIQFYFIQIDAIDIEINMERNMIKMHSSIKHKIACKHKTDVIKEVI